MTVEDDIVTFKRIPTLALLGPEALRIMAIGAETRYLHAGDVLFAEGEPADCGYVVREGSLTLTAPHASEKEAGIAHPGTLLGELALVTDTMRPVTATAREPSSVIRVSRSMFLRMLEGYPDAAERLRRHLAGRTEVSAQYLARLRDLFGGTEQE
jgi:CRP-like cAMP-binding protein